MKSKGFTLVELLTIIVLISFILIMAIPKALEVFGESKDSTWASNVNMIRRQIVQNAEDFDYTIEDICDNANTLIPEFTKNKSADIVCSKNVFSLTGVDQFEGMTATIKCRNGQCKSCITEEECEELLKVPEPTPEPVLPTLAEVILENNEVQTATPKLTTSSNNDTAPAGLYKLSVTNGFGGADGDTYYFRGNVTNNYVSFAGQTWRIVRINEDGTVRLMLNTGINNNQKYTYNNTVSSYENMYYSNSTNNARPAVETWFNTNIIGVDATKVAIGNYFCEAAKVKQSNSQTSGSATMKVYSSYTPDFKCTTDGNGKGLLNLSVGLITYDETVAAGGFYGKVNSDYYLSISTMWWLMSPAGVSSSTAQAWRLRGDGRLLNDRGTYDQVTLRPVINMKASVSATGTGIESDPYVIN